VPVKIVEWLIIIIISIPIFLLLTIGFSAARVFLAISIYVSFISTYIIPPLKKKNFKKFIGKSIWWYFSPILVVLVYFPVSILIYLQGYGYGLYNSNDVVLILLNYIPTISATILMLILFVLTIKNFTFETNEEARDWFLNIQNEMKNLNYLPFKSHEYLRKYEQIKDMI